MNIVELIQGLILNAKIKPRPPVIYIPTKPRLQLTIDVKKSIAWKGIVWHHSAVKDNVVLEDSESVIRFHKSFRIDGDVIAGPVKEKHPGVEYIKYENGEWYKKSEHDKWLAELDKQRMDLNDKRDIVPAWMNCGYHGMEEDVESKVIFHWGRPLSQTGAHAGYSEFNKKYLGFCSIGDYDTEYPTDNDWQMCLMITRTFMDVFQIPVQEVIGHREVYDRIGVIRRKQCPGKKWDMDKFRKEI